MTVEVEGRRLKVSNLDKVLYPATETTKGEVLHYYAQVASTLLPHLADRPVTRIRWPNGVEGQSFFEKNLPSGAPGWLPAVTIDAPGSRSGNDEVTYPLVGDVATLTYLANLASLELHVPQWRIGGGDEGGEGHELLPPDRLVIDLDPGPPAGLPGSRSITSRSGGSGRPFSSTRHCGTCSSSEARLAR
jgi:bifunctional non-homologous end joining protein LigD